MARVARTLWASPGAVQADPVPIAVRELLASGFVLPLDDPAYRDNGLLPGRLPFELSFTDHRPSALRFDLEPFVDEPDLTIRHRRGLAWWRDAADRLGAPPPSRAARHIVAQHRPGFGCFLGGVIEPTGLVEAKIYLDLGGRWPEPGEDGIPAAAIDNVRDLGFAPLFVSLAAAAGTLATRSYFVNRADMAVRDTISLMHALGLAEAAPRVVLALAHLVDGPMIAANGVVIGLSVGPRGPAIKFDLVVPAAGNRWLARLRHVTTATAGVQPLDRWLAAMRSGDSGGRVCAPTFVSVRVGADGSIGFGCYATPGWLVSSRPAMFA